MNDAIRAVVIATMGVVCLGATKSTAGDLGVGHSTRELLAVQSSNAVAGSTQRLSAAAQTRVYKRYLDSFTHQIPEFYEKRDGFISQGARGRR
jgi:hypothetical protein